MEGETKKKYLKSGGEGITITPVSPPSSKPTTPLPNVTPPPEISPPPSGQEKREDKMDIGRWLLFASIIPIAVTLWILVSIILNKIPPFL